ncbi:hypothetical protein LINGRAHAP2_LOCUS29443, partial [Linum grandiflorum]
RKSNKETNQIPLLRSINIQNSSCPPPDLRPAGHFQSPRRPSNSPPSDPGHIHPPTPSLPHLLQSEPDNDEAIGPCIRGRASGFSFVDGSLLRQPVTYEKPEAEDDAIALCIRGRASGLSYVDGCLLRQPVVYEKSEAEDESIRLCIRVRASGLSYGD